MILPIVALVFGDLRAEKLAFPDGSYLAVSRNNYLIKGGFSKLGGALIGDKKIGANITIREYVLYMHRVKGKTVQDSLTDALHLPADLTRYQKKKQAEGKTELDRILARSTISPIVLKGHKGNIRVYRTRDHRNSAPIFCYRLTCGDRTTVLAMNVDAVGTVGMSYEKLSSIGLSALKALEDGWHWRLSGGMRR